MMGTAKMCCRSGAVGFPPGFTAKVGSLPECEADGFGIGLPFGVGAGDLEAEGVVDEEYRSVGESVGGTDPDGGWSFASDVFEHGRLGPLAEPLAEAEPSPRPRSASLTSRRAKLSARWKIALNSSFVSSPNGIRTRAAALKGRSGWRFRTRVPDRMWR